MTDKKLIKSYIALGANIGDAAASFARACASLAAYGRITAASKIYRSKPQGYANQPDFYNSVIAFETTLPPTELLQKLQDVEAELGRVKTFVNGPRVIDLDIILYGDVTLDTPSLVIPHPRAALRAFVVGPLSEIAPDSTFPPSGLTASQLYGELDETEIGITDQKFVNIY